MPTAGSLQIAVLKGTHKSITPYLDVTWGFLNFFFVLNWFHCTDLAKDDTRKLFIIVVTCTGNCP